MTYTHPTPTAGDSNCADIPALIVQICDRSGRSADTAPLYVMNIVPSTATMAAVVVIAAAPSSTTLEAVIVSDAKFSTRSYRFPPLFPTYKWLFGPNTGDDLKLCPVPNWPRREPVLVECRYRMLLRLPYTRYAPFGCTAIPESMYPAMAIDLDHA